MNINNFKLNEFPDGSLYLECGDGMERDLVFASSAMAGDPDLEKQRDIMKFIINAIHQYDCDDG